MSNEKKSGWFENPDQTGKAPEHAAAAQKSKTKETLRQPMMKKPEKEEELQVSFVAKECKLEILAEYTEAHGLVVSEEDEDGIITVIAPDEERLAELEDFLNEKKVLEEDHESEEEEDEEQ